METKTHVTSPFQRMSGSEVYSVHGTVPTGYSYIEMGVF